MSKINYSDKEFLNKNEEIADNRNAQSANNQFVVINGQHYNYTDNLTSIKIGCLGEMKFKKGTTATIYKSRY